MWATRIYPHVLGPLTCLFILRFLCIHVYLYTTLTLTPLVAHDWAIKDIYLGLSSCVCATGNIVLHVYVIKGLLLLLEE